MYETVNFAHCEILTLQIYWNSNLMKRTREQPLNLKTKSMNKWFQDHKSMVDQYKSNNFVMVKLRHKSRTRSNPSFQLFILLINDSFDINQEEIYT